MPQEATSSEFDAAENRLDTIGNVNITDPGLLEFWNRIQLTSDKLKVGLVEDLYTKTRAQMGAAHPDYLMQVARILLLHDELSPFANQARILAAYANGENLKAQSEIAQAKATTEGILE